jgi:diguanylate cyclase (GGDEF)-like protein
MSLILLLWAQIIASGNKYLSEYYIFPIFLIFCSASLFLFEKYDLRYLPIFESLGYVLSFLYFSSHFLSEIYTSLFQPELEFRKFLIWIPVMYGLAFVIYPPQKALRLSAIFFGCIFAPGLGYGIAKWGKSGFVNDLTLLLQIYASGPVYISFFYIIAALKDKFSEVDRWARIATSHADTDSLTKCYSRRKIIEILDTYTSSTSGSTLPFSIAFIDVDHLKQINDTYGHLTGDYVLRRIVEVLSTTLRDTDMLGRIGGDEFLLILPNTDANQAQMVVKRLQHSISDTRFENVERVTVSIGVATMQNGESKESLLTRADADMYHQRSESRYYNVRHLR